MGEVVKLILAALGMFFGVGLTIRAVGTLCQSRVLSPFRIIAGILTIAAFLVAFVSVPDLQFSDRLTQVALIGSIAIGTIGGIRLDSMGASRR